MIPLILPIVAFKMARVIIEVEVRKVIILMIIAMGPNFCKVERAIMFVHLMLFKTGGTQ